jgi:hypothetical protein
MIKFPEGFIWGAATSSYQIDGAWNENGKGESVWDALCHIKKLIHNGDTGDIACDHYHRYKEDVQLMKEMNLQAYRFSVSWPRIFPKGKGKVNLRGVEFYDNLINELIANAITIDDVNKIFLIGGGEGCQLLEKDFLKGLFDAFGLKMLPEKAFKVATKKEDWFYIDWMDTKESQEVLQFQTMTFQQYINKMKNDFRMRRLGIKIISPIAKLALLRMSPYSKS